MIPKEENCYTYLSRQLETRRYLEVANNHETRIMYDKYKENKEEKERNKFNNNKHNYN